MVNWLGKKGNELFPSLLPHGSDDDPHAVAAVADPSEGPRVADAVRAVAQTPRRTDAAADAAERRRRELRRIRHHAVGVSRRAGEASAASDEIAREIDRMSHDDGWFVAGKKSPPPAAEEVVMDVSKLDIRVGTIVEAWEHEDADRLFCEIIDIGEEEPRKIATGLRAHYKAEDLVGRRVCVLANLKTRKLVGFPSHGMVLCASTEDGSRVVFVDPPADAAIGERCFCDGFVGEPATENQVAKKKILDKVFPDFMTDGEGVVTYKGVPLTAGSGKCVAGGGLANAQVA